MDRKVVRSWCLYDFGNSAFAILFPFIYGTYFADHVVGDRGRGGEWWWGLTMSTSMLAVAVSAPLLGGIADHSGARKRLLALYTALGVAAVLAFTSVSPGAILPGFLLGALANFAFEGGIVFYNAYLPDIAPPSHHGRVSARGFAVGYVGSVAALGAAALLLPHLDWIWIALAAQWALFSLPAFFLLPADRRTGTGVLEAAKRGLRQTRQTLRSVLRMHDLRRFLLAYFFYMDGVNTAIVFAAVYAKRTLGFEVGELLTLMAAVQVAALVGSLVMAGPTDVKGPKWTVRLVLLWWIGVVTAAHFAQTKGAFWAVAVLAGLGLGSIQAASRAFMSRLIPAGREGELFGFYALCGKTGAILGPFLFGQLSVWVGARSAILALAAFYVAGLVLLRKVEIER
ncbi:MAG: MFS transporter [Planctomycetota bacterium]